MSPEPTSTRSFSSLADMERRFVSSNRRSISRRAHREWRTVLSRRAVASVAIAATLIAGGYAVSRLELSPGSESPALASTAPASVAAVGLTGCPLPAELHGDFAFAARDAGVAPALLVAVAQEESRLDPKARSHAGAVGLLQLLPSTARELGLDPSVRRQNVLAGARYLRRMTDRFGRTDLALAAYNAGPNAVVRGRAGAETVRYVARVQRRLTGLAGCRLTG